MIRDIHITPVLNGFICDVGCQRVVIAGKTQLLNELARYLDAPEQVEKEYVANAVNRMPEQCQPGAQRAEPPPAASSEPGIRRGGEAMPQAFAEPPVNRRR